MSISTMVSASHISSPNSPQRPFNAQVPGLFSVPPCIGTPIEENVYGYFLTNFISGTSLKNHGYFDFLFPLLGRPPESPEQSVVTRDTPLSLAFSAVAIIAFAARQKVPELLPKAESMYLRALEATFKAIGDPLRAWDNSTLASVTLLTTFEQLRPSRPSHKKAEAFGSHLDGALALIKLRGKDCFQTLPGRKIFVILRSLLVGLPDQIPPFFHVVSLTLTHTHTKNRSREAYATPRPSTPNSTSSPTSSTRTRHKSSSPSSPCAPPTCA